MKKTNKNTNLLSYGSELRSYLCLLVISAGIQNKKYAEVFLKTNKHHNKKNHNKPQ